MSRPVLSMITFLAAMAAALLPISVPVQAQAPVSTQPAWVAASGGQYPPNAVYSQGTPFKKHVCRAALAGQQEVGTLDGANCLLPPGADGQFVKKNTYEVLTSNPLGVRWAAANPSRIPTGAFDGAKGSKQTRIICRGVIQSLVVIGHLTAPNLCAINPQMTVPPQAVLVDTMVPGAMPVSAAQDLFVQAPATASALKWARAANGQHPANSLFARHTGIAEFVCRATVNGKTEVGTLVGSACQLPPVSAGLTAPTQYDVAVATPGTVFWMPPHANRYPNGSVNAANAGEPPRFVCRGMYKTTPVVGYLNSPEVCQLTNVLQFPAHSVLVDLSAPGAIPPRAGGTWTPASNGQHPADAVVSNPTAGNQFVCRTIVAGQPEMGTLIGPSCLVPSAGKQPQPVTSYEVLVSAPTAVRWAMPDLWMFPGGTVDGSQGRGVPRYICRGTLNTQVLVGFLMLPGICQVSGQQAVTAQAVLVDLTLPGASAVPAAPNP